jgi:hypothetical protein
MSHDARIDALERMLRAVLREFSTSTTAPPHDGGDRTVAVAKSGGDEGRGRETGVTTVQERPSPADPARVCEKVEPAAD